MDARMLWQSVDVAAVSVVLLLAIGVGTLAFAAGYSGLTAAGVAAVTAGIGGWSLT